MYNIYVYYCVGVFFFLLHHIIIINRILSAMLTYSTQISITPYCTFCQCAKRIQRPLYTLHVITLFVIHPYWYGYKLLIHIHVANSILSSYWFHYRYRLYVWYSLAQLHISICFQM